MSPASLVISVKVGRPLVRQEVPAKAATKAVIYDVGAGPAKTVCIPTVGVQRRATIAFVGRAMEGVGAALGDHDHLRASSEAETLTTTRVVGFHAELLDALYGRGDRALGRAVEGLPIVRV